LHGENEVRGVPDFEAHWLRGRRVEGSWIVRRTETAGGAVAEGAGEPGQVIHPRCESRDTEVALVIRRRGAAADRKEARSSGDELRARGLHDDTGKGIAELIKRGSLDRARTWQGKVGGRKRLVGVQVDVAQVCRERVGRTLLSKAKRQI